MLEKMTDFEGNELEFVQLENLYGCRTAEGYAAPDEQLPIAVLLKMGDTVIGATFTDREKPVGVAVIIGADYYRDLLKWEGQARNGDEESLKLFADCIDRLKSCVLHAVRNLVGPVVPLVIPAPGDDNDELCIGVPFGKGVN